MRLAHLTDPHLSQLEGESFWRLAGKRRLGYLSWMRRRRYHHRREILDQLTAALARERPDVIAVTGDLVQIGLAREHAEAMQWLDALAGIAEVVLVPGNHDTYQQDSVVGMTQLWAPHLHIVPGSASAFPSLTRCGPLAIIGLCSARPEPFWSAAGELGAAQLERLEQILLATSGQLRCVLIHHPPLPGICPARKSLRDAAQLKCLLAAHDVGLVLYGHIHSNRTDTIGVCTRVCATASASNNAAHARAAYRLFDFEAAGMDWRIAMELKTLDDAGTNVKASEHAVWEVTTRT